MGLIAFWSISGIFILGSASWWVATREMGEGAYYIKRQIIWLAASNLEKLPEKKLLKKLQALKSEEDRHLMKLWAKDSRQQLRREK